MNADWCRNDKDPHHRGSFALWGGCAILEQTLDCSEGSFPNQVVSHLTGTASIVAKLRRLVKWAAFVIGNGRHLCRMLAAYPPRR
jgi:hypothetical protein